MKKTIYPFRVMLEVEGAVSRAQAKAVAAVVKKMFRRDVKLWYSLGIFTVTLNYHQATAAASAARRILGRIYPYKYMLRNPRWRKRYAVLRDLLGENADYMKVSFCDDRKDQPDPPEKVRVVVHYTTRK